MRSSSNFSFPGSFSPSDLERRVCAILDAATVNLKWVAKEGFTDAENPNNNLRPEKVIGETAFLLYVVDFCAGYLNNIQLRIQHLARELSVYARSEKIKVQICLYPSLALELGQAHTLLSKIGYADPAFDELLAGSISAQSHKGKEREPHRMLEQKWIKRMWKTDAEDHDMFREIILFSSLNHPPDLLHSTRDDMYALTHALLYIVYFDSPTIKLPRQKSEILAEIEALLCDRMDQQDYDLAGELLFAWPLLNEPWSDTATFAFQVLLQVEEEAGLLPSISVNAEACSKLSGEERQHYLFATSYHTMYVMCLLCAMTLQDNKYLRSEKISPPRIAGSTQTFFDYLEAGQGIDPHWIKVYSKLNQQDKELLAAFVYNIALIRSVRGKKYESLYELLTMGYSMHIADTPLASQAAEFLERISFLSHQENQLVITSTLGEES